MPIATPTATQHPRLTRTRRTARVALVLASVGGLSGLALATASPASAIDISYSVRNVTAETLSFQSATATRAGRCVVAQIGVFCVDGKENIDWTANVAPKTVLPGQNIGVYSSIEDEGVFNFRQKETIVVTYLIGTGANDKVVLYSDPNTARCTVHGTQKYKCNVLPVGVGRDFELVRDYSVK